MWSFDDPETYTKIFYEIYRDGLDDKRFKIDSNFRQSFHPLESIPDRLDSEWPDVFEGNDEMCKNHRFYMNSQSDKESIIRRHLVEFSLNDNKELNGVKVISSEVIYDAYAMAKKEATKDVYVLDDYRIAIPLLVYAPMDESDNWYIDYSCYTNKFLNNFKQNKYILLGDFQNYYWNEDYYLLDTEENNELTDIQNKIVGVRVKYFLKNKNNKNDEYFYKNFKVHFEVDDRNFLDSITKIEEVLEDGTIVEVENNFGK